MSGTVGIQKIAPPIMALMAGAFVCFYSVRELKVGFRFFLLVPASVAPSLPLSLSLSPLSLSSLSLMDIRDGPHHAARSVSWSEEVE